MKEKREKTHGHRQQPGDLRGGECVEVEDGMGDKW